MTLTLFRRPLPPPLTRPQPYLAQSPLAYAADGVAQLQFEFWQQHLQSLALLQRNKFHVARQLTGQASGASQAQVLCSVVADSRSNCTLTMALRKHAHSLHGYHLKEQFGVKYERWFL